MVVFLLLLGANSYGIRVPPVTSLISVTSSQVTSPDTVPLGVRTPTCGWIRGGHSPDHSRITICGWHF